MNWTELWSLALPVMLQGAWHTLLFAISSMALGLLLGFAIALVRLTRLPVLAPLAGMVRGLLHDGLAVTEGFKIGDIDPRGAKADHLSISDKARAIAGGVLEAMLSLDGRR